MTKILITGGSGFIGTNTLDYFLDLNYDILNIDLQEPLNIQHLPYWKKVDILDRDSVEKAFSDFQPEMVIHMAARADCDENTTVEKGYNANTSGTKNVLTAVRNTTSVKRVIVFSSQFVCGPNHPPKDDHDYHPVTVYGQSKVITEQLTREADLKCIWTIVRPTNIWGPWHKRYTREFWKIAAKGCYLHPGGKPVTRCYGYVGNLVFHLDSILKIEPYKIDKKIFYLSDLPADIYAWANAFTKALSGRNAKRIPRSFLKLLGYIGDIISYIIRKPFYITSGRVNSMTSDYVVDNEVENTFLALGHPPYSLDEGILKTMQWLKSDSSKTLLER